jgi:hypothetical protein
VVEGTELTLVAAKQGVSRPMLTEQLRDGIDLIEPRRLAMKRRVQ